MSERNTGMRAPMLFLLSLSPSPELVDLLAEWLTQFEAYARA